MGGGVAVGRNDVVADHGALANDVALKLDILRGGIRVFVFIDDNVDSGPARRCCICVCFIFCAYLYLDLLCVVCLRRHKPGEYPPAEMVFIFGMCCVDLYFLLHAMQRPDHILGRIARAGAGARAERAPEQRDWRRRRGARARKAGRRHRGRGRAGKTLPTRKRAAGGAERAEEGGVGEVGALLATRKAPSTGGKSRSTSCFEGRGTRTRQAGDRRRTGGAFTQRWVRRAAQPPPADSQPGRRPGCGPGHDDRRPCTLRVSLVQLRVSFPCQLSESAFRVC